MTDLKSRLVEALHLLSRKFQHQDNDMAQADKYLALAASLEGMCIVPVEPNEGQQVVIADAAIAVEPNEFEMMLGTTAAWVRVYKAMLKAAEEAK